MKYITKTTYKNSEYQFHVNDDGTYNIIKKNLINNAESLFEENLHKLLATLAFDSLSKGEPIQRSV